MERLFTLDEVSGETGIPPGTLRYWRHLGKGPQFKKRGGRRLRVSESDLKAWIAEQADEDAA